MAETIAIIKRVLDTVRSNGNIDIISAKNDDGARFIEAVIAVDGKPVHVDQGAFVTIEAKRADMQSDAFSGEVNENGTVKVPITQWMLEIPNTSVEATVVVHSAKTKLSTTNFYIKVQNAPHGSEEISPDDSNYDILIQVLAGEDGRVAAENARQSNEVTRQNSENYRNQNEETRVGNENARMINEDERITNERARVSKDSERDGKIAKALADSKTAKADSAAALDEATTAAKQANAAAAGSASAKSDAALAVAQSNSTRTSLVNLTAQVAGIGRTYVVPTFLDFIDFLKSDYSIVLKEDRDGNGKDETYYIKISDLKSGDNIIITEKGVPDFWFERNAALTEFESYTYEGTEYSLRAILGGLIVGGAHMLETDYSVIEGHAISAAASANQALLAAGDAAGAAGEAQVQANKALQYSSSANTYAFSANKSANRAEAAAKEAEETVKNGGALFSNALKGKKSGGIVSISDISPLKHALDVRVRGKNLAIVNDFELKGLSTNVVVYKGYINTPFVLSWSQDFVSPNGTASFAVRTVKDGEWTQSWGDAMKAQSRYTEIVNPTSEEVEVLIVNWAGFNGKLINIQLEVGTVATEYTPNIPDLSAVKVKKFGKNLFNDVAFYESNGWSFDESKQAWLGTSVGALLYKNTAGITGIFTIQTEAMNVTDAKAIYFRVYYTDGSEEYKIGNYVDSANISPYSATTNPDKTVDEIRISYGNSGSFYMRNTMISCGINNSEYEPYIEPVEYAVNADGTVDGVTSIYPTTTLLTDTAGAVIDVEYNRDINKAFAELYNAIISLGGNV